VLWRWVIWSYLLWAFSRHDLDLGATHPDRSGGIAFLADPAADGFVWISVGVMAVASANWVTQMLFASATFRDFAQPLLSLLLLQLLLAFGPLCAFARKLYLLGRRARMEYGRLGLAQAREFARRWVETVGQARMLDTCDPSAMADFDVTYNT